MVTFKGVALVRDLTSRYRTELERVWLCPYCQVEFVAIRSQLIARSKRGNATAHCGCQVKVRQSEKNTGRVPINKATDIDASIAAVMRQCVGSQDTTLIKEDVASLITQPCHYCGTAPNHYRPLGSGQWSRVSAVPTHGIDRLDSGLGYHKDNCVPCCSYCNYLKGDRPYAEFTSHIKRIAANLPDAAGRWIGSL